MARAGRITLAVVAGAGLWAVLWVGGTKAAQAVFPDTLDPARPLTHPGFLLGYIGYSVVLSVLAGWVTAAVGGPARRAAVGMLAGLQLTLGVVAEVSYWSLLPVWYHLVFLALIVPATLSGGLLRARAPRQQPAGVA
jgi:hypothetical protein